MNCVIQSCSYLFSQFHCFVVVTIDKRDFRTFTGDVIDCLLAHTIGNHDGAFQTKSLSHVGNCSTVIAISCGNQCWFVFRIDGCLNFGNVGWISAICQSLSNCPSCA